jgi:hypothetical protein
MLFVRSAILVGLALSIGWGVRGNFGHEYGAMLPGVLAALAAILMLGRSEWLPRIAYFAFFGGLGWAFGGSISYMQVISYTHSGHLPSQIYGFGGLWIIGFLWAGMGGLATAWPAETSWRRLTTLFRPLVWVFVFWFGLHFVLLWLAKLEASFIDDTTWNRQASALYWMDSDWIQAMTAGLALMAFDFWDRRGSHGGKLILLAGIGAGAGWLLQQGLTVTGLLERILVWPLVQYQADPDLLSRLAVEQGLSLEEIQADALTNWPNWFQLFPQHVGWVLGMLLGLVVYFSRYGRFRSGAGLLVCMVVGWFAAFLLMPVLLGFGGAGLRMTPPRGDNWAGIVGVLAATLWWCSRHGYWRVIYAGLLCGILGGFGFAGTACLKLLMIAPGNPNIVDDAQVVEAWRFWQHSNWHSFLEQTYGFVNGLGLFLAIWWLTRHSSRRISTVRSPGGHWTHLFSIAFVIFGVIYLNMRKNISVWVESKAVPESMRMPWFESIELSAATWFNLAFAVLAIMGILLLRTHRQHPLAWIPAQWAGRGQLLFLVFLWTVVVMNFERALVGFSEGRLLTEGVIFFNAVLASWMISCWVPSDSSQSRLSATKIGNGLRAASWLRLSLLAVSLLLLCLFAMPWVVRTIYGDHHAGHSGLQKRFGPDALWKTTPIFKSKRHS